MTERILPRLSIISDACSFKVFRHLMSVALLIRLTMRETEARFRTCRRADDLHV